MQILHQLFYQHKFLDALKLFLQYPQSIFCIETLYFLEQVVDKTIEVLEADEKIFKDDKNVKEEHNAE